MRGCKYRRDQRRSDTKPLVKIIEHEREKTGRDMTALREDLARFEGRYNIPSGVFFERFEAGQMGDNEDFFEWSAIFRMYVRSQERLKMLEGAF